MYCNRVEPGPAVPQTPRTSGRRTEFAWRLIGYVGLVGFVAWLLLQHRLVFPAHDDWGLAALDYVVQHPDGQGRTYGIGPLIEFVRDLYMKWTGRVAAMFAVSGTFRFGVDAVRIVQCSVLLSIALLSARICTLEPSHSPRRSLILAALVPATAMLCMPERVVVNGLYWFTAAAVYAWGVPLLLAAAVVAKLRGKPSIAEAALLGACALFSELLGAAAVAFAICRFLDSLRSPADRTERLVESIYIVIPLALFALCALAPGNFARYSTTEYPSTPLPALCAHNFKAAGRLLAAYQSPFLFLWTAGLLCLIIGLPRTTRTGLKVTAWIGSVLLLLAARRAWIEPWVVLAALLSVHGGVLVTHALRDRSHIIPAGVFLAAVASLMIVLAISPYVASRSLLTFVLLMVTPISWGFIGALTSPRAARAAALLALSACLAAGIHNSKRTYDGCAENYQVHEDNDVRLRKAAIDFRLDPSAPVAVEFHRLPRPDFAEKMPYERPIIERWIRKYYNLPKSTQFVYPEVGVSR
jgi:hypothetical protein